MSESIKIVGEWRTMERLTPGVWLSRLRGLLDVRDAQSVSHECRANPVREYIGPLEIIEPEPEPTPLPGCRCFVVTIECSRRLCESRLMANNSLVLCAYGDTRRQAILRHNAAVKAIVEMEKLT